ncbi:hypothetical protein [Parvibium lacunae]|nr:hypothetical protein [Parvibium lacunae]
MRTFEIKVITKTANLFYKGIFMSAIDAIDFALETLALENSKITVKPCAA